MPLLHSWIPKFPEITGHRNCAGRDDIFIPSWTQTTYEKATCFEKYLSKTQSCSGDRSCSTARSRKGFLRSRSLSTVQQTFTQFLFLSLGTVLDRNQQTVALRPNPAQYLFFANKVLLKYSHACSFTYCLYRCFPTTTWHFNKKNIWTIEPNRFTMWSFTENACEPLC